MPRNTTQERPATDTAVVDYDEMSADRIEQQLARLRDQAGAAHYTRLKMADALLKKREWVTAQDKGGGDENTALDRLEGLYFADIVGVVSLPELLDLFHHFPDIATWQKHRFNMKKMWVEWRERTKAKSKDNGVRERDFSVSRNGLTAPASWSGLSAGEQKREYIKSFDLCESYKVKSEKLENQVRRVTEKYESELTRVKGQLESALEENRELKEKIKRINEVMRVKIA